MSRTSSKRVVVMPSVKDNAKIVAAAKADLDAKPMTKAQLDTLVPIRAVRGRPKSANLQAELQASIAEAESGDTISSNDLFARLRRIAGSGG